MILKTWIYNIENGTSYFYKEMNKSSINQFIKRCDTIKEIKRYSNNEFDIIFKFNKIMKVRRC